MSYTAIEQHLLKMIESFQVTVNVPGQEPMQVPWFVQRTQDATNAIPANFAVDEQGNEIRINERGERVGDGEGTPLDLNQRFRESGGIASIAEYELLANPKDNMCFIEAGPPGDVSPMGFGSTWDRFYKIEWKPSIHCLFRPPPEMMDEITGQFLLSNFNNTLGLRINQFLNELIRRPTLAYDLPDNTRVRYGIDEPSSDQGNTGFIQSSQIILAEPTVEATNIFRGDAGPYNFYVGVSIVHRIVEGYQLIPIL